MASKAATSKIERPEYINSFIQSLNSQINNADMGQYIDQQYTGLSQNQLDALNQLAASPELRDLAQQYTNAGKQGLGYLDSAYNQLQSLYNDGGYTAAQQGALADQLYDEQGVNSAIDAQNAVTKEQLARSTIPQIVQQYNSQGGFGSGAKMAKGMAQQGALNQMQSDAANISNQAYQSAMDKASSILSGNQQNRGAALSGLVSGGAQMSGLGQQAGDLNQQVLNNQLNAGNIQQNDQQTAFNNAYQNAINQQNYGYQQINNLTNAASVLNGAQGQTSTTTVSGGSNGFGGALTGAVTGAVQGFMMGGPYGALAGAAVGGASGYASDKGQ